jgi:hypothetical protein
MHRIGCSFNELAQLIVGRKAALLDTDSRLACSIALSRRLCPDLSIGSSLDTNFPFVLSDGHRH